MKFIGMYVVRLRRFGMLRRLFLMRRFIGFVCLLLSIRGHMPLSQVLLELRNLSLLTVVDVTKGCYFNIIEDYYVDDFP